MSRILISETLMADLYLDFYPKKHLQRRCFLDIYKLSTFSPSRLAVS